MSDSEPKKIFNDVFDACTTIIKGLPSPDPNILYHFTDVHGFDGIIRTQKIWASLATAMNDARELLHGIDLAKEILQERLRNRGTEYDRALLYFLENPTAAPPELRFEMPSYVVSFCSRIDRSGQWLHYGSAGQGLAIGFSPRIHEAVGYDLIKVDYSIDSQRERIRHLIDAGIPFISAECHDLSTAEKQCQPEIVAHIVSLQVPMLAARMKHPSFSDEHEWRLVGHDIFENGVKVYPKSSEEELKFRQGNGRLIPYHEPDFTCDARRLIKEIVIGYSSPMSEEAARLFVEANGLNPDIRRSEVSVR